MPRSLNEPEGWRASSLMYTSVPRRSLRMSGVGEAVRGSDRSVVEEEEGWDGGEEKRTSWAWR